MDRRVLVLISALCIQGLYGAAVELPSTGPISVSGADINSAFSNLTPEDAKVLQELQNLRNNAENFQQEAMGFIQNLPNRLSAGFQNSHQLFKILAQMFSSAVNEQLGPIMNNLQAGGQAIASNIQAGGQAIASNANRLAAGGLARAQNGLDAGVNLGQSALDGIRRNGRAVIQGGMSYLGQTPAAQLQTRSLPEELPMQKTLSKNAQVPSVLTDDEEDLDEYVDENSDFDFDKYSEDGSELAAETQKLATRDDKPVTTVLTEQLTGVGTASSDLVKNTAQFASGGLMGFLNALSAVLNSGVELGGHARTALGNINKSGNRAIGTAIDTTGSLVSGALDKTGSIVQSMSLNGAANLPGANQLPTPPVVNP